MLRSAPRSFTGDRSPHCTGAADGCSVRTYWAGTNLDGSRCCATSTAATAKAASSPPVLRITGVASQLRTSVRWSCSMALGKQQRTIRGPKPASKKSNSMWMTSLSQFPLLDHPNQKVQNSRLGGLYLAYDLLGGEHGPLRLLTRMVTYSIVFGIGYGIGLGFFFGVASGAATGITVAIEQRRTGRNHDHYPLPWEALFSAIRGVAFGAGLYRILGLEYAVTFGALSTAGQVMA